MITRTKTTDMPGCLMLHTSNVELFTVQMADVEVFSVCGHCMTQIHCARNAMSVSPVKCAQCHSLVAA